MTDIPRADAARLTTSYPPASLAWRVIATLFLVTVFSQLDRQLPALLVGPIKSEFGISDTAFSLLQGYAFALVYTLAGLPFGRLVDRTNRRNLIIGGVVVWSVMTALAGLAQSYWMLFICRMGVGIGEACLAPAAYSMIADYVPPLRRGRALGIYYVSLAIGAGASLLVGGLILRMLPASGLFSLEPWRIMFVLAGAPGLALALLLLTVKEPVRRETSRQGADKPESFGVFLRHLKTHWPAFARIFGYTTLLAIIAYGAVAWAPAFYVRRFGMNPASAGMATGIVVMISGLLGTLTSAFLSDRWLARGVVAARFRVTFLGCVILTPGVVLWPLVPNPTASLALLGLLLYGGTFAQAAAAPALQDITPNSMRGQAIAIYLMFSGLLGIGFGPTAVALVSDRVFHSEAALPYALVTIGTPLALFAVWLCGSGLKAYAQARATVAAELATAERATT